VLPCVNPHPFILPNGPPSLPTHRRKGGCHGRPSVRALQYEARCRIRRSPEGEGGPRRQVGHACWGRPDIFAFCEAKGLRELTSLVFDGIQRTDGIEASETHIVAEEV